MASLDILYLNSLNLKNKITKIEHKKIFCGPSKILKNISWPVNIYQRYFMTPSKTLRKKGHLISKKGHLTFGEVCATTQPPAPRFGNNLF